MRPYHEPTRKEEAVFAELKVLASSPGFAHAIAAFCFRDNTVPVGEELTADDIAHMFSEERLLRTEISTLIGLLVQSPLNLNLPEPQKLQEMLDQAESLLGELHDIMNQPAFQVFRDLDPNVEPENPFTKGSLLREPIFYGGESAYLFQYRNLAVKKYSRDNPWLAANKNFTIEEAHAVVDSINRIRGEKLTTTQTELKKRSPEEWTMLPAYTFSVEEVVLASGLSSTKVSSILAAFILPATERNSSFQSVCDFNATNAFPLIPLDQSTFICFLGYSLAESLYESPFFWMIGDKNYSSVANDHRGRFTEDFCAQRLTDVFGREHVFKNVLIKRGKDVVGEIDVMVVFADRVIIVQAKSKKLTVEARKGNDNQLQSDFKQGIQAAYEQGLSCARLLSEEDVVLQDENKAAVHLTAKPQEIFLFCVLSENYPALAFQARQFLEVVSDNIIKPPFVMDVFALDAIAEMLSTPLLFLSYIHRRVGYADRVLASHELTILSYHLKQNLWIDDEYSLFQLHDDITADLDVAMLARREGLPGKRTPDGILSKFGASTVGKLLRQIEHSAESFPIDLGFLLLKLNDKTLDQISSGIDVIAKRSLSDRKLHDITLAFGKSKTGLTIHANFKPDNVSKQLLLSHCERRKYSQRAETWFGLCLDPHDTSVRFGIKLDSPWQQSDQLDEIVADLPRGGRRLNLKTYTRPQITKVGRNDPCPCGSGEKYKKCCLARVDSE